MSVHAALEGITVVALEQAVAAPYCTSRLADAGARVIKVERPDGDFARAYDKTAAGHSAYFVWLNRGKESICLDLKQADDAALLSRMIGQADVFVQNLAPGAAARLGFGADELRARFPRLVTVDISGYGQNGDYADMKAYDLLVQCETGLAHITGSPEAPGRVGVSVCDVACGMYAHAAVLQALIARGRSGSGASIQVSLFDALADWMSVPLLQHEGGTTPGRVGLNHPTIAPYGAYACAEGQLVVLSVQNQREWARFCTTVLEDSALAQRPEFATNEARLAHRAELDERINVCFRQLSQAALLHRLRQADIAFGAVRDLDGLQAHPALRRLPQDVSGAPVAVVAPPAVWPEHGALNLRDVPELNAHGAVLRREFAAAAEADQTSE